MCRGVRSFDDERRMYIAEVTFSATVEIPGQFNRLWRKHRQKSTPDGEKRSGDRLASFPGGKPENEATRQCHVGTTFTHTHNNLKCRPTPRQVLERLVFRLIRTDTVTKVLWYRGHARGKMQS